MRRGHNMLKENAYQATETKKNLEVQTPFSFLCDFKMALRANSPF